jgi:hypothetical protein
MSLLTEMNQLPAPHDQFAELDAHHSFSFATAAVDPRIASPEMFPEAEMLPHLICSRPILIGGANDEADQHGGA